MKQVFPLQNPLSKVSYSKLPSTAGIYLFKKGKTYLYIGKSVNIKARVLSHVENTQQDVKELAIVSQADSIETQITDSEFKALLLESELIQIHHPKYNIIWRDGKSHLYIKITEENYPKIYPVRKEDDKKSLYFGPFSSTRDVDSLLRTIRRIIPFCSQKRLPNVLVFIIRSDFVIPAQTILDQGEKSTAAISEELFHSFWEGREYC